MKMYNLNLFFQSQICYQNYLRIQSFTNYIKFKFDLVVEEDELFIFPPNKNIKFTLDELEVTYIIFMDLIILIYLIVILSYSDCDF